MSTHRVEIGYPNVRTVGYVGRPTSLSDHVVFDIHEPVIACANITESQARELVDALIEAYPSLVRSTLNDVRRRLQEVIKAIDAIEEDA